jgi:predicted small metal-binding protein
MTLVPREGFVVRCPRCKRAFSGDDREELADALVAHGEQEHGHPPPREHVVARVVRVDERNETTSADHERG